MEPEPLPPPAVETELVSNDSFSVQKLKKVEQSLTASATSNHSEESLGKREKKAYSNRKAEQSSPKCATYTSTYYSFGENSSSYSAKICTFSKKKITFEDVPEQKPNYSKADCYAWIQHTLDENTQLPMYDQFCSKMVNLQQQYSQMSPSQLQYLGNRYLKTLDRREKEYESVRDQISIYYERKKERLARLLNEL